MRISSGVVVGLIAVAAVAAFSLAGGAGAQNGPPAKALRIAILDMNDCMNIGKSEQAKSLQDELDAGRKTVNEELKKMEGELQQLGEKIKVTAEGSELFAKLAMDFNMGEHKLKVTREMRKQQLLGLQNRFRTELYSAARKVATRIAEERKIDLVLRGDDGAFEEERTEMTAQKNVLRSVLYFEPSLDITPEVLKRLNEDFKKQATCPNCKIVGKDGKCPKCDGPLKTN